MHNPNGISISQERAEFAKYQKKETPASNETAAKMVKSPNPCFQLLLKASKKSETMKVGFSSA